MFEKWFQMKTLTKNSKYYKKRCLELAAEIDRLEEKIEMLQKSERETREQTIAEFARRVENSFAIGDAYTTASIVDRLHAVVNDMTDRV